VSHGTSRQAPANHQLEDGDGRRGRRRRSPRAPTGRRASDPKQSPAWRPADRWRWREEGERLAGSGGRGPPIRPQSGRSRARTRWWPGPLATGRPASGRQPTCPLRRVRSTAGRTLISANSASGKSTRAAAGRCSDGHPGVRSSATEGSSRRCCKLGLHGRSARHPCGRDAPPVPCGVAPARGAGGSVEGERRTAHQEGAARMRRSGRCWWLVRGRSACSRRCRAGAWRASDVRDHRGAVGAPAGHSYALGLAPEDSVLCSISSGLLDRLLPHGQRIDARRLTRGADGQRSRAARRARRRPLVLGASRSPRRGSSRRSPKAAEEPAREGRAGTSLGMRWTSPVWPTSPNRKARRPTEDRPGARRQRGGGGPLRLTRWTVHRWSTRRQVLRAGLRHAPTAIVRRWRARPRQSAGEQRRPPQSLPPPFEVQLGRRRRRNEAALAARNRHGVDVHLASAGRLVPAARSSCADPRSSCRRRRFTGPARCGPMPAPDLAALLGPH
jgi:hypothetical protein